MPDISQVICANFHDSLRNLGGKSWQNGSVQTDTEGDGAAVGDTAGWIVALCGDMMTMPGLGASPAAERMRVDEDGTIHGLF
jgi:hypothetical protein